MTIIILISFLVLAFPVFLIYKKNLFSLEIFLLASFGLVYILPIVNPYALKTWQTDTGFLLIIWISIFILVFSIMYKGKFIISKRKYELKTNYAFILFFVLTFFFVYQIFNILKLNSFNVVQALVRNRVAEYLDEAKNFSDLTMKLISILQIFYLVLVIYVYQNKSKLIGILGYLNLLIFILLITHTRFILLSYLLMPVFYYNEFIKTIKVRTLLFLVVFAALFLSFTNYARTGIVDKFNIDDSIEVTLEQIDIKSVGTFHTVYSKIDKNEVSFDYMKHYLYYFPMTFIPRAFWPSKPIVSYFWRLTKIVSGSLPGKNNYVLTSTIFGEGYHQGGVIGMFLVFLFYVIFARTYISFIDNIEYMKPFKWMFLIHIPMDIRGAFSSLFVTYLTTFLVISFTIFVFFKKVTNK
jgi:oligosaccharide repeat unit polymerase